MHRRLIGGSLAALVAALAALALTAQSSVASLPGTGKPAVVIGDKNFAEEYILGDLYADALKAQGYSVTLKPNIGSSEITWKALLSGQIQLYPEYTGEILSTIAGFTNNPTSASAAYQQAVSYAGKHGLTLLKPTPFYDSDALAVTAAYAKKNNLKTISDLKKLGSKVVLGGAPTFATREEGLLGLKKDYGIDPTFKPIAIGLGYTALDSGKVDVQDVFTTDGQLAARGKYVILTDPSHVFGYQNVVPVVQKKLLAKEGPAFAATLNKVDKLLTFPAMQQMNKAVSIDQDQPAAVATAFLKANGIG
ncbi:MAG TPA: glycine betaine ABC transporter substrate-binding protein [Solirubrobacteraceae bacterium]